MAFDSLQENEDLLLEKEENHLLQQTVLHDVEYEKEDLKDSFFLEEEHVEMHEVFHQPMHIVTIVMEEIYDEDDLLDEFDAIFSSIYFKLLSPIYEEHVLQQKPKERTLPTTS